MLTRLKVSGFKNLVDTEVRFGPFTCIAGPNGVGKSNIFDAIRFLALLADHTFVDAARQIRGGGDPASLFNAWGNQHLAFECDVIVPRHGQDDFHQTAEASHTFLTYALRLRLAAQDEGPQRIELVSEQLTYVPHKEARKQLGFPVTPEWLESAIGASNRRAPYIETMEVDGQPRVRLSVDKMRNEGKTKRGGGRPADFLATTLPRSVLSAATHAEEARTAVLVRAEMRSWRVLQLEPSSLRVPDELHAPSSLTVEGQHLPATLHRLASGPGGDRVLAEVSNRLSELVDDIREVRVVRDDLRRALQVVLTNTGGQEFPAASLSDGTLRFVALSVLARDPSATGLFCLEEPENGIHPKRMKAMLRLLTGMATDLEVETGADNPLHQVIISTHSPVVVAHTRPADLLFADHRDPPGVPPGKQQALVLRPCGGTWRAQAPGSTTLNKGTIIEYLGSLAPDDDEDAEPTTFREVLGQLALRFGSR